MTLAYASPAGAEGHGDWYAGRMLPSAPTVRPDTKDTLL
jgi:hypothetical protein